MRDEDGGGNDGRDRGVKKSVKEEAKGEEELGISREPLLAFLLFLPIIFFSYFPFLLLLFPLEIMNHLLTVLPRKLLTDCDMEG